MKRVLTFAPLDLAPLGPMFASSPAFAIGDSVLMYESTDVDWARTAVTNDRRTPRVKREVKRILVQRWMLLLSLLKLTFIYGSKTSPAVIRHSQRTTCTQASRHKIVKCRHEDLQRRLDDLRATSAQLTCPPHIIVVTPRIDAQREGVE